MGEMPGIEPRQWVSVGERGYVNAVVCGVHNDHIEVVYLDDRNRAINEDVLWSGSYWEFKIEGPCGGYADKYSRLSDYVHIPSRE